ncbi:hypothetical protein CT153_12870 [Aeromonas veronii]|nr:hypothetical protein CT153_12870 [Aeromonas veronii]
MLIKRLSLVLKLPQKQTLRKITHTVSFSIYILAIWVFRVFITYSHHLKLFRKTILVRFLPN